MKRPVPTCTIHPPGNYDYGLLKYEDLFNPRQLLTLVTYVEIINEAKALLKAEYEPEKVEAIATL